MGIPEDVFQNVFLDHKTTSALIADRAFGFVNFTGSVGGGKAPYFSMILIYKGAEDWIKGLEMPVMKGKA